MGTGCDTILAQIAAEVLECPLENIAVLGADTDSSPYDSGSYASSTTYVTGKAVEKCALELKDKICTLGAQMLGLDKAAVLFTGDAVTSEDGTSACRWPALQRHPSAATRCAGSHRDPQLGDFAPAVYGCAAEVEVDLETGEARW